MFILLLEEKSFNYLKQSNIFNEKNLLGWSTVNWELTLHMSTMAGHMFP